MSSKELGLDGVAEALEVASRVLQCTPIDPYRWSFAAVPLVRGIVPFLPSAKAFTSVDRSLRVEQAGWMFIAFAHWRGLRKHAGVPSRLASALSLASRRGSHVDPPPRQQGHVFVPLVSRDATWSRPGRGWVVSTPSLFRRVGDDRCSRCRPTSIETYEWKVAMERLLGRGMPQGWLEDDKERTTTTGAKEEGPASALRDANCIQEDTKISIRGFFWSDRRKGGRSSSSGGGRSSPGLVRFPPRASSPAKWRGSDPSPTARGWSRQAHGTQHLVRIHELPHQDVFGTTHGPLFTRKFVGCARLTAPDPTRQPIDPRTRKGVLARRGIVPEPGFPCGSSSSVHVPLVGSVRDRSFRRRMSVFDTHFPSARDTCLPLRWSFQRIRRHVWHLGRAGCQG